MPGHGRASLYLIYNEIARRLLMHQEPLDIAQQMAVKLDSVKAILRRPEFLAVLEEVRSVAWRPIDQHLADTTRNLKDDITQSAVESFKRLDQIIKMSNDLKLVAQCSQDMLDRAGYGKVQKVEATDTLRIDPLEAQVLTEALQREQKGRDLMKQGPLTSPVGDSKLGGPNQDT